MHEYSLVRNLLSQVDEIIASHGGGTLRVVRVQIGPLAGIEPTLIRSVWEQLRCEAGHGACTLELEEVPLVAHCRDCDLDFRPVRFRFHCPHCGSTRTDVVTGDAILLDSIVLDEAGQGVTL